MTTTNKIIEAIQEKSLKLGKKFKTPFRILRKRSDTYLFSVVLAPEYPFRQTKAIMTIKKPKGAITANTIGPL